MGKEGNQSILLSYSKSIKPEIEIVRERKNENQKIVTIKKNAELIFLDANKNIRNSFTIDLLTWNIKTLYSELKTKTEKEINLKLNKSRLQSSQTFQTFRITTLL